MKEKKNKEMKNKQRVYDNKINIQELVYNAKKNRNPQKTLLKHCLTSYLFRPLSREFFYLENKGKVFTYSRELEKDFRAIVTPNCTYTEMPRRFCEIRLLYTLHLLL